VEGAGTVYYDIYRAEVGTTNYVLVNVNADGDEPTDPSCDDGHTADAISPALSGDGSRIAFQTAGVGLSDADDNCTWDVYLRDLSDPKKPTTTLVSVNPDGYSCTSGAVETGSGSSPRRSQASRSSSGSVAA